MPEPLTMQRLNELRKFAMKNAENDDFYSSLSTEEIASAFATIDQRDELIRWLESMRNGQPRLDVLIESAPHEWQRQNAAAILEIVAARNKD